MIIRGRSLLPLTVMYTSLARAPNSWSVQEEADVRSPYKSWFLLIFSLSTHTMRISQSGKGRGKGRKIGINWREEHLKLSGVSSLHGMFHLLKTVLTQMMDPRFCILPLLLWIIHLTRTAHCKIIKYITNLCSFILQSPNHFSSEEILNRKFSCVTSSAGKNSW